MENQPKDNEIILQNEAPKKEKKKMTPKQIVYLVLDVILFPILIFATFFSLSLIITRATKGVPSVFGYSMVIISSGSMKDAGFEVGTKTFIKSQPIDNYEVGDYIAFYDYVDPNCQTPPTIANGITPTYNPSHNRIVFHEIIEIITDANGNLWFRTKGTNNDAADRNLIYQNYVIGEYVEDGNIITGLFGFLTSTVGILVLIALPCTIILFRDCYELINLAFIYNDKRKFEKQQAKMENKLLKEAEEMQTQLNTNQDNASNNILNNKKITKKDKTNNKEKQWTTKNFI